MTNEYEEYDELPEESADVEAYDPEASSSIGDGVTKSLADGLKGGGAQGGSPTGAAFNAGREGAEKAGGAVGDALGGGVGEAVGKDVSKAAVSAGQVGAGVYSGDVSSITEGGKELLKTNTGKVGAVVSWIAGLFNPASAVVIGAFILILGVVFGGFSIEQTIGKNEHACETNSDCSVAKRISGCDAITGDFAWPSGATPGSAEAGKAVFSLIQSVFQGVSGWNDDKAYDLLTISWYESKWDPTIENSKSSATGLFQILASHDPSKPRSHFHDPKVNAEWAKRLYEGSGNNFNPWKTWPGTHLGPDVPLLVFNLKKIELKALVGDASGGNSSSVECSGVGGVSGPLLQRLNQRADMIIELARRYPGGPACVPGYNAQGVFSCGGGWGSACTAISMMIWGHNYVGVGDGGSRSRQGWIPGKTGTSWPPPPGAIVSWNYAGNGHVAIHLGNGEFVDNWPNVARRKHPQVLKGASATWKLPPESWEGNFLNSGVR